MRISINLATRPFTDLGPALKRLRIGMAALAVLSAGFWLGIHLLGSKAEAARLHLQALESAHARLDAERQGYLNQLKQPNNAAVLAQAEALNRLIDEKSFSWTLAMEDLETVLPGGVQVVNLEPVRAKDGTITLHMRVQGPRDRAVTLVENLEHSRRFVQPRIVNETAETGTGPAERVVQVSASTIVNFDLLADYNPATAQERAAAQKKTTTLTVSDELPAQHAAPFHAGPGALRPPYTGAQRPQTGGRP
jgi:type IV pilus assembly protein PilN